MISSVAPRMAQGDFETIQVLAVAGIFTKLCLSYVFSSPSLPPLVIFFLDGGLPLSQVLVEVFACQLERKQRELYQYR